MLDALSNHAFLGLALEKSLLRECKVLRHRTIRFSLRPVGLRWLQLWSFAGPRTGRIGVRFAIHFPGTDEESAMGPAVILPNLHVAHWSKLYKKKGHRTAGDLRVRE